MDILRWFIIASILVGLISGIGASKYFIGGEEDDSDYDSVFGSDSDSEDDETFQGDVSNRPKITVDDFYEEYNGKTLVINPDGTSYSDDWYVTSNKLTSDDESDVEIIDEKRAEDLVSEKFKKAEEENKIIEIDDSDSDSDSDSDVEELVEGGMCGDSSDSDIS